MRQICTTQDIKRLGTIMSVWAHPDDESYLSAGVMAAAVKNGQTVICVTATKGEAGSQDEQKWPPKTLGEVRAKELKKALQELGVTHHHWLSYKDGTCSVMDKKLASQKLTELLNQYEPDTILTFGPDGLTGHPDHQSVSRWVDLAIKDSGKKCLVLHAAHTFEQYERHLKAADEALNIFFNIDKPPLKTDNQCAVCFRLPHKICELKCNAVAAMPSQTEAFFNLFGRDYIKEAFAIEYFVEAQA